MVLNKSKYANQIIYKRKQKMLQSCEYKHKEMPHKKTGRKTAESHKDQPEKTVHKMICNKKDKDISVLRKKIDRLDDKIVKALAKRIEISKHIKKIANSQRGRNRDFIREAEIINRLKSYELAEDSLIEKIWKILFEHTPVKKKK